MVGNPIAFCFNDRYYVISGADWLPKTGICKEILDECPYRRRRRCSENLIAHCCKHVVHGTELEKEAFLSVVSHDGTEKCEVPACVEEAIVNDYRDVSRRILEYTQLIGLSSFNGRTNVFCEGAGEYDGYSDYLAFDGERPRLGIVSSYLKISYLSDCVLLDCIYKKYHAAERLNHADGYSLRPYCDVNEIGIPASIQVPNVDYTIAYAGYFFDETPKDNDYTIGVLLSNYWDHTKQMRSETKEFYGKVRRLYNTGFSSSLRGLIKEYSGTVKRYMFFAYLWNHRNMFGDNVGNGVVIRQNMNNGYHLSYSDYLMRYEPDDLDGVNGNEVNAAIVENYLKIQQAEYNEHYKCILEAEELVDDLSDGTVVFNPHDPHATTPFYLVFTNTLYFIAMDVYLEQRMNEGADISELRSVYNSWKRTRRVLVENSNHSISEWVYRSDKIFKIQQVCNELNEKLHIT